MINERAQNKRLKRKTSPYMHPRLRSAYLNLKRNIPLLWTFYDHPGTGLPNTNNALEGLFSDLKTKVRVHSGISKEHRKKLLDEYIKRHYSPAAPSPEYMTSGDYRSSTAGGSAKGPSSRLTVALALPQMSRWRDILFGIVCGRAMGCVSCR